MIESPAEVSITITFSCGRSCNAEIISINFHLVLKSCLLQCGGGARYEVQVGLLSMHTKGRPH